MLKEEVINYNLDKSWNKALKLRAFINGTNSISENLEVEHRKMCKPYLGSYLDINGGIVGHVNITIYESDIKSEINMEDYYLAEFSSVGFDSDYHSISIDVPCDGIIMIFKINEIDNEVCDKIREYLISNNIVELGNEHISSLYYYDYKTNEYDYNYGWYYNICLQNGYIKVILKDKKLDNNNMIKVLENIMGIISTYNNNVAKQLKM